MDSFYGFRKYMYSVTNSRTVVARKLENYSNKLKQLYINIFGVKMKNVRLK